MRGLGRFGSLSVAVLLCILLTSCSRPAGASHEPGGTVNATSAPSPAWHHSGSVISEPGWNLETIDTLRYGADGASVFYSITQSNASIDSYNRERVVRASSVEATPVVVGGKAAGVPEVVAAGVASAPNSAWSAASPDGRFNATLVDDGQEATLTVMDTWAGTGHVKVVRYPSPQIGWLDSSHLVVSWGPENEVLLLDASSGSTRVLFSASSVATESRRPSLGRVAVYPNGLVLFSVETWSDSADSPAVRLYEFEGANGRIVAHGAIADGDTWDYNPLRGTVVFVSSDAPTIVETPLSGMR